MRKKKKKGQKGSKGYAGDSNDPDFEDILERKPVAKEGEENPPRRTPYFN